MRKFNVYLENNEKVYLTEHDLTNSGGEGEIFIKDNFAYKIYFDSTKVISLAKIKELSLLNRDNIVRPIQVIRDEKGVPIGYQMNVIYPEKCFPLTRFFTTDFRNQYNITDQDVVNVIRELYFTFEFIHDKGFLIVDGNEMNFLISDDFKTVYFIDVDSYKTPSFKPTAFNPTTLDPMVKENKFNENSDWYIFAVLFCQITLGIHPFKGKYTGTSLSFGKRDLTKRMELGVSVLNPKVKLNKAVRSLSLIPQEMKRWLDATFKNEKRTKPPLLSAATELAQKIVDIFNVPNGFKVFEQKEMSFDLSYMSIIGKNKIYRSGDAYLSEDGVKLSSSKNMPFTISGELAFAKLEQNVLSVYIPSKGLITEVMKDVDKVYSFNDELFIYKNNKLSSVDAMVVGKKVILGVNTTWDLYHHQRTNEFILFYQSGKRKAYYFYETGKNAVIDIDEMLNEGEKLVNIKGYKDFIVMKTIKNGDYSIKIVSIDLFSKATKVEFESTTETTEINFINKNGLLVGETSDETLLIGAIKSKGFEVKEIKDYTLNKKLFVYKDSISFADKNKIYRLAMV